jgi:molybdenum cofactor cytidylyltransferase
VSSSSLHIACVVLAAGRSTRMGATNKLTADLHGKAVVRHTVEAALASKADRVLVVTGHQAEDVRAALAGLKVGLVHNPDFASGLASSLTTAIRALPEDADGAVVMLGDMPQISAQDIDRLLAAFAAAPSPSIVVPTHEGRRGNPVIWPRALFAEMLQLDGDAGAKRLLTAHADRVREVEVDAGAIFADVDTPDALEAIRRGEVPRT